MVCRALPSIHIAVSEYQLSCVVLFNLTLPVGMLAAMARKMGDYRLEKNCG